MKNRFFKFNLALIILGATFLYSCNSDPESPRLDPLQAIDLIDESYGESSSNTMDVFLPAGRSETETSLIIYIHGGAWISGDKSEFLEFKPVMENSFPEYAFISINYRLLNLSSGDGKFPDQENDVIEAIEYVLSKTKEWNISDQIILAGASAGGHLALLHSYKHQEIGDIQAVFALFPPTDLSSLYDFNSVTKQGLEVLLSGTPDSQTAAYMESSPIEYVSSNSIPTIFFHGTEDTVVPISQSDMLSNKLEIAGVPFYYESIPGEGHGFKNSVYPVIIQKAADFINEEL
ncbi:alpha/beta hydrolase [Algoriphagus machipongonensis]|uniref:Lipase n=1 Tax=Algoriphagus machipongonensis TaxID=388413 RepID=A3HTV6_9BACT|nr:alpha/beta hydrolase [Algoriphagus machipongonensis]EAZ81578.2 putative lipase [Algoriphagus machipongonensis]